MKIPLLIEIIRDYPRKKNARGRQEKRKEEEEEEEEEE